MRVVTSCRGRFHIFDQARELAKHGALHQLITDYPRFWPARFGVPADRVRSLLVTGLVNHGLGRARRFIPRAARTGVDRWVHDHFSRRLARVIPADTQYFVGLSSFTLDALHICRELGIPCAVDHGSLHQRVARQLVDDEAERWGLTMPLDHSPDWLIEKEDREFQAADSVFAMSDAARASMVRCGVPAEKIFVNPCGVDVAAFGPGPRSDVFRIIQVGNISVGKGVLTLLDAFARVQRPGAELWFVGGGLETSGLQTSIKKLSTRGVAFKPPVPQSELLEYYRQSSVFVLASVADGFAMVVPQAMACELAVIVTENVGARDLIEDGVNGFVVPVGSPELIADRLRLLHDDPERRRAMGQAARRTVEQGYRWQDYGDRLVGFIQTQVTT